MTMTFGRAPGAAQVTIDAARCTACGRCVQVCRGGPLTQVEGRVEVAQGPLFSCIGCGQCVTACPVGCLTVEGRDLFPHDVTPLPPARADYAQLDGLLRARRSTRDFHPREVDRADIDRLLATAATAPMGLPPSEVEVRVFAGRARVRALRADLLAAVRRARWMTAPWMLTLLRPLLGREGTAMCRDFIAPVLAEYLARDAQGEDWFLYDAPLALYFSGTACADPADPVIAATYATLAAEALGLGSCLLGFPPYLFRLDKTLRTQYALPPRCQPGLLVVCGYPAVPHHRALTRRFARVAFLGED